MGRLLKGAALLLGAAAAAEAGGTAYFYRRTMKRYNAKVERTIKMSGVDWESHFPFMHERSDWMMAQPHEDVWIRSKDGLKLHKGCHLFPRVHQQGAERLWKSFLLLSESRLPDAPHR